MRVSNEEKQKSRARILKAASRRFRENGIAGTGVADVMKDAGMTHGGFYKHFDDKDALVRAALAEAFGDVLGPESVGNDAATFNGRYLSTDHRDNAGKGCPLVALGGEVARLDTAIRAVMSDGVQARIALLQNAQSGTTRPREAAIRDLATLVGALVLSRAVEGPLSDEVLAASRDGLALAGPTGPVGD
jgi:TetR/AcrR family transcriptional regulator, transcriptional repressor for nem operon